MVQILQDFRCMYCKHCSALNTWHMCTANFGGFLKNALQITADLPKLLFENLRTILYARKLIIISKNYDVSEINTLYTEIKSR